MNCRNDSIRVTGEPHGEIDTRQLAHLLIRMARRQRDGRKPVPRRGVYKIDGDESEFER